MAAGQLKRASRQAFYPYTLQFNAYTLDHLHKHLFHGAKSLTSMAYGILLLWSKLCRRAAEIGRASCSQLPTYHLANIVDDHLMEVTHVIRGEEWKECKIGRAHV